MRYLAMMMLGGMVLAGCEGPEGPAGEPGPAGAGGPPGVAGLNGANGDDGDNDGATGPAGADGNDGVDGVTFQFEFRTDDATAYTRVDRAGMPAVATAVISYAEKDNYNAADPVDDDAGDFAADIEANIDGLHTALDGELTGLGLTVCATAACVAQAAPLVIPDTVNIDTAAAAGFPNGRLLTDQVIDITLALVLLDVGVDGLTALVGTNPTENDRAFMGLFPYVASPHM